MQRFPVQLAFRGAALQSPLSLCPPPRDAALQLVNGLSLGQQHAQALILGHLQTQAAGRTAGGMQAAGMHGQATDGAVQGRAPSTSRGCTRGDGFHNRAAQA